MGKRRNSKSDKTDNFEMLFRVHAPGEGRVVCLCKASSDKEILSILLHGEPNLAFIWNLHRNKLSKCC